MTKNGTMTKLKSFLILTLAVISIFCLSIFTLTACNKEDKTDDTTYTKVETDTAEINNGSFEFGSADVKLSAFPQSSATGWSSSVDNSASSSVIKSGIISTTEEGFKALLENLYADNDFVNFTAKKFGFDVDAIKTQIETENPTFTSKEINEKLKELLLNGKDDGDSHIKYIENFANPGTHNGADGSKIYMLNNYRDAKKYYNFGTAQKLTSSSTINLEAGSYGKISVWVKTAYIEGSNKSGANIRLSTTVNSVTQDTYAVYGIRDTEWTNYSIYVKADDNYACTVKVILGLGFGNGNSSFAEDYTEGTAYFDDVTFTKLTATEYAQELGSKTENKTTVSYSSSTSSNTVFVEKSNDVLLYDLDISTDIENTYFTKINPTDLTVVDGFTTSNTDGRTSISILGEANSSATSPIIDTTGIKLNGLKNAAYMLEIDHSAFSVTPEGYVFVSFKISNELARYDTNGISVFVKDYKGSESQLTTVKSYIESGEETVCNILIKNNFNTIKYPDSRLFKIVIYVGPYDFSNKLNASDFATGNVVLSDFKIASGKTYQYVRTYNGDTYTVSNTEKTEGYKYYTIFSQKATATVSLFAGETGDYNSSSTNTYVFSSAPSDIGSITTKPAVVNNYLGVPADHAYIKTNSTNYSVNDSETAGLINTKFLSNYSMLPDVQSAIGSYQKDIQPIVIYNPTTSAYGFIGDEMAISANTYYTVSVKVRVVGNAKAYIYLVDASSVNKDIITINTLTNTDGYGYITKTQPVEHKLMRVIDSSMMQTTGDNRGWLTVNFYVATGKTPKNVRLEVWNGGRDNATETQSQGYVFFDDVATSNAFTEPSDWTTAFTNTSSILYQSALTDNSIISSAVLYQRELDSKEIAYNKTVSSDEKISYPAKYIYAENKSTVYAIYNTIDPVSVDPTPSSDEEDTQNCSSVNSSTFWLQFSSILLIVVLIFALIALVVKTVVSRKRANKNDAKSYYTVKSRYSKPKTQNTDNNNVTKEKIDETETTEETSEDEVTEISEENEEGIDNTTEEQNLDEYVYNDVQDFGEVVQENQETIENATEEPSEESADKKDSE